ncbi:Fanconi anemia group D2 protein-like isoform X2 [Patiria miniata]|uniref:Fanconi anemia group D2 protein n=1 Tax=Patiria miniata TaxID=46514 RepID=A0A913ZS36_PATMI|nr:Fanconi anemia group D2 protein-like isoform X2 [Patiria miniata]
MGKARTKRKSASTLETTPGSKRSKKLARGSANQGPSQPTVLNDDSTFGQLVKDAGFVLMADNSPNQLSVDQAMFQQRLSKALKRSSDLEQIVEEFTSGIQNHIEDPVRFKYSLLPTLTSAECESARGGNQDSLMRLLLGIDELQSPIINVLLEKLPEFMEDQDMFDHSDAANLPRLILNQFQWLDRVLNSEEMTNKMLEMVSVSSLAVQQEIIACIPEVVSDSEHNTVATQLKELLFNSSELTVPVLDALSNLNLTPDLMTEVRNAALQTLISADLEDLPVIIKFILQSVSSADAVEVISQVRTNLEFPTNLPSASPFTPHRKRGSGNKNHDNTLLILDAIKTNMRFQKVVTEGWIKAVENVHTASEHKVIDIFILLIAHTVASNRKKALESLFRSKVRSGHFREELLKAAFSSHAKVIREYFPSILSLAEVLLRSPEPAVSLFACCIYRQAFLAFDVMYYKQEVIGSLVAHIGSGFQGEIEAGLDVLLSLVEHHASDVAPFAIFIKGVLDYLGNLSLPQIRKLFSILSVLAFRNTQECANIQDELHIVIRKQLSSNSPKYKRIGVIGSLMIVRNMAFRQEPGQGRELSTEMYNTIVSLLGQVRSSSSKMPEASALFFDELANIVEQRQLDQKVEEFIGDSILNDFQDDFVVDVEADQVSGDYGLPLSEVYGLEAEESQGGVAINLLPLVSKAERAQLNLGSLPNEESETDRSRTVSPLCMTPHFRLLRMCEMAQNDNMEGIDALLGCPLYNVSNEVISKISSLAKNEREMLCTCLFLTINWFREIVNAFSGLTDAEMRGKVLARLKNITEVQKHLQTCLAETPNFSPPLANFDNDSVLSSDGASTSTSGPTNTATVGSKRGRKPKEKEKNAANTSGILNDTVAHSSTQDTSLDTTQNTTQNRSTDTEAGGSESVTKGAVDLSRYRTYFRELDIDVFNILGCGLVTKSVLDSEMHTREVVVLKLQPPELHFLLEDLSLKLDHALLASSTKRRTFLKTKSDKNTGFSHLNRFTPREIAVKAIKLLPHLCDHLESTSAFFQALVEQNDGVVDGPGANTPEYHKMATCLHLLLKSLLSLFSWNGFASSENKSLFLDALKVLTSRIKSSGRTQLTAKQLHKHAFSYLEKFLDTVPDLSSAIFLLRLLVSLSEHSETTDNSESIADMAEGLLKREWLNQDGLIEKGAKHNELLQSLLRIYLCHTPDVLKSIQDICTIAIPELIDSNERTGYSTTYQTLNRLTFGTYYRVLFDHLTTYLRDLYARGASKRGGHLTEERLIRWSMAVHVFHVLISLLKVFEARSNLTSALKYGRVFIELFLKHGMPLLDRLFPSQREEVLKLLKTLQQSTRSLHHVCSHSKVAKDVSLTNHVPAVKRNLELFVYRVKAMLALHKCQEAFWVGNLKNRDLHGEEILSQQANDSASENGDDADEDTELPSEDSSSGDESTTTMGQEEKSDSDDESCSESF